jgi:1,4-dihydroxy-2-naphthoyl-CoA hydrolase
MLIWKKPISVASLTRRAANTAITHVGIEFMEVGDDFLTARLPVTRQTCQPMGLLHGGVSVVLAETLGSIGAAHCCSEGSSVVGLDINANHLRAVREGWVTGRATPIHIGRTTQVWKIDISDQAGKLTCVSRLTMAVIPLVAEI